MIVVGITGASGSIIGIRLIEELLKGGEQVTGVVSEKAWLVIEHELSCLKKGDAPLTQLLDDTRRSERYIRLQGIRR